MKLTKGKGWHFESLRHFLASKGLKTGRTSDKPLIVSTDQQEIKHLATSPLKHSKPGTSKYHKWVTGHAWEKDFFIDAMVFHSSETKGRPIIIIDKSLPESRRREVILHESLHLKYPKLSEQQVRSLTTRMKNKK